MSIKPVFNAIDIKLEMDRALSKGWLPLNKWIASGKPEGDWIDFHEFNRVGGVISAEFARKRAEKDKNKTSECERDLMDEISLLKNLIKNGLTINDYLASKEKELDLIQQLDN